MTEKNGNPEPRNSARRKLVRGAFAAPAVLTVFSGSASAATSALSCLVRANSNPGGPVSAVASPAPAPGDRYLRYQLWAMAKSRLTSIDSYYVKGDDIKSLGRPGQKPYLTAMQGQKFATSGSSASSIPGPTVDWPPQAKKSGYSLQRSNSYIVLRFDSNGAIVGAGDATVGAAVTQSCWTSFLG